MNLVATKESPPLAADEHGAVRVGGTRVLLELVVHEFDSGASPEEIVASYSALSLSDVYSTIAYVLRHRTEVDRYLADREAEAAELQRTIEERFPTADLRAKLLARADQR